MKKNIRLEINKLAQKILTDKENFDVVLMKRNVGELYEKLAVLAYLESQLEEEVNTDEAQSLDSKSYREENWFTEPEPLPQSENKEELVEPLMEKIKDIVAQMPEESQSVDELLKEVLPKKEKIKNDLEEFASTYQETPIFERKEPTKGIDVIHTETKTRFPEDEHIKTPPVGVNENIAKPQSLNDKLNQGLNIGLNDKLAFIKHLFDGNSEDYKRVLSQLETMNSYNEAAAFINGKIKPEYNSWSSKEEFSDRFMTIVEKSFN